MDSTYLINKHDAGLDYQAYLTAGSSDQQAGWRKIEQQLDLSDAQHSLISGFTREMKVLVLSAIWCGDCVRQGPMFQKIADASGGRIDLKWLDRDKHMDLQERVRINGGNRVPVVIFCAEDGELVGWYGDKTLSRYREQAAQALGAHCPLPGAPVPQNELNAELTDWVNEFERVHLLLRISARLRQKHGD